MRKSAADRFAEKYVVVDSACWIWTDYTDRDGYGLFRSATSRIAHRFSYELVNGPIPKGMHLDHLCKQRNCVNPKHLEAVTPRENVMRSRSLSAENARKTHCKRGHDLGGPHVPGGKPRQCKPCHAILSRNSYYRRKRAS